MKYILVVVLLAVTVGYGQDTQTKATGKTVVINTQLFDDEQVGIVPLVLAVRPLYAEMKGKEDELRLLLARYSSLTAEISRLTAPDRIEYNERLMKEKIDEADDLLCNIRAAKENLKTQYYKRRADLTKNLMQDIGRRITEFANDRLFNIVIINELTEPPFEGLPDLTLDFINYYNSVSKK